jgi:hypothetical protein
LHLGKHAGDGLFEVFDGALIPFGLRRLSFVQVLKFSFLPLLLFKFSLQLFMDFSLYIRKYFRLLRKEGPIDIIQAEEENQTEDEC